MQRERTWGNRTKPRPPERFRLRAPFTWRYAVTKTAITANAKVAVLTTAEITGSALIAMLHFGRIEALANRSAVRRPSWRAPHR